MFRVALKGLLGHKLRFLLTAFAVVLGVTFVSGAFVLTDSMDEAFGELLGSAYEGVDVAVRAASPVADVTTEQPGTREPLPASLLDEVAAVDGVAKVSGHVEGYARVNGPDGQPLGLPGAPNFGFSWGGGDGPITLKEGSPPSRPGEMGLDAVTVERGGFALGDEVEVVTPTSVGTFTLVGIMGFGESDNLMGATIATFDLATARELFDREGQFDELSVTAQDGVEAGELRARLIQALDGDYEVVTTADQIASDREAIATALGFLSTVLLAFAGVALFVGAFIIANTFSIVVAQRQREFALLRAVGASARQVRTAVLVEALAVGVLAATAGLFLGVGFASVLRALLGNFGVDLPGGGTILAPRTIVASYAIGVVVTTVASLGPARRAARVAPVEAMRGATLEAVQPSTRRTVAGAALALVGGGLFLVGLGTSVARPMIYVGAGAVVVMLGVAMLAPAAADPFARIVGSIPARLGVAGSLARGNARRNPRRTAATASALMIGLALVSFVTILASSIRGTVSELLNEQFRADFILRADTFGVAPLPDEFLADLRADDSTDAVVGVRWSPTREGNDRRTLAAVDPTRIEDVVALGADEGSLARLGRPGTLMLAADVLAERDLTVGDELVVTFISGDEVTLEIVGSYEASELVGSQYLVSDATLDAYVDGVRPNVAYVTAAGDLASARAVVADLASAYQVQTQDRAEFRQQQDQQVNQLLGLMMVLLALAIVIALLGIANTLVLSVFERIREVGLLRAVGMTRRQVGRMVLWESMIIAVFGAVLGVLVGTGFGVAMVEALSDEGIDRLVVPGGQLAIYVAVAAAAGALAALFPAWRAARLDVLAAVTTE